MYEIKKTFKFDAAHRLSGLPIDHKCSNLHGHTYHVTICLTALSLGKPGFVADYATMDRIKEYIDTHLDHKMLNDVLNFNPTAELIAKHLYDLSVQIYAKDTYSNNVTVKSVTVSETESTSSTYGE